MLNTSEKLAVLSWAIEI